MLHTLHNVLDVSYAPLGISDECNKLCNVKENPYIYYNYIYTGKVVPVLN
jgi:hypothetical protein